MRLKLTSDGHIPISKQHSLILERKRKTKNRFFRYPIMENRKWRALTQRNSKNCKYYGSKATPVIRDVNSIAARSRAVELAKHVESRNESDEAQAHHQHHGWRNLQPWGFIRVKPQHVGATSRSTSNSSSSSARAASCTGHATAAHASGGSSRATWSHDSWARGGGGGRCGGLRLRCPFRHGLCKAANFNKAAIYSGRKIELFELTMGE